MYARNAAVINEEAFLRRAVHNLSIDQYRRDRPDLHQKVPIDGIRLNEWLPEYPDPEQIIEAHQRLHKIGVLLQAASTRTRDIYMAHRAGYTYAEIVDHMNVSGITVRRHIARALQIAMEHQAKEQTRAVS